MCKKISPGRSPFVVTRKPSPRTRNIPTKPNKVHRGGRDVPFDGRDTVHTKAGSGCVQDGGVGELLVQVHVQAPGGDLESVQDRT
eukprot:4790667-Pyramimonas_sp.AAC.1